MTAYIVTGITGYLGSKIAEHLLLKDPSCKILGIIRKSSSLDRIQSIKSSIKLIEQDELTDEILNIGIQRQYFLIHCATCYGRKNESPDFILNSNLNFPISLITNLKNKNINFKFINIGTSLPSDVSIYSKSKNDFAIKAKNILEDNFINLIFEQFYGPDDGTFINFVISNLKQSKKLELTKGTQKRDFIFIDDAIEAIFTIIKALKVNMNKYCEFEVGSGKAISIREVVEEVIKLGEFDRSLVEFGAKPERENEVMFSQANIEKIKELGWTPKTEIALGLKKCINKSSD